MFDFRDLADEELVERAKANDQGAYTELYRRTLPRIRGVIFKILHSHPEQTEDCVQETVAKAFLKIDSFKGNSKFATWCTRIAINEAVMLLRKLKTEHKYVPTVSYDQFDDEEMGFIDPVSKGREFEALEARYDLAKFIHLVPRCFRDALIDRYIYGYEFKEMAAKNNRSIGGMKSNAFRGRAFARKIVQNLEKENPAA